MDEVYKLTRRDYENLCDILCVIVDKYCELVEILDRETPIGEFVLHNFEGIMQCLNVISMVNDPEIKDPSAIIKVQGILKKTLDELERLSILG